MITFTHKSWVLKVKTITFREFLPRNTNVSLNSRGWMQVPGQAMVQEILIKSTVKVLCCARRSSKLWTAY